MFRAEGECNRVTKIIAVSTDVLYPKIFWGWDHEEYTAETFASRMKPVHEVLIQEIGHTQARGHGEEWTMMMKKAAVKALEGNDFAQADSLINNLMSRSTMDSPQ